MKKRDLIAALQPLDDDTEILIADGFGCPRDKVEYFDDRFRGPLISRDAVRLEGCKDPRPGEYNPRLSPPKILGVDPLRPAE